MERNLILIAIVLLFRFSMCTSGDACPPPSQLGICKCTRKIPEVATRPPTNRPQHGNRVVDLAEDETMPENATLMVMGNTTAQTMSNDTDLDIEGKSRNQVSAEQMMTIVECTVKRNAIALEQIVVPGLHRKLVDKLTVTHVLPKLEEGVVRLPSQWLKNTRVKQIEILHTALAGDFIWAQNPFEGQEKSLIILKVNYCSLKGALTYDAIGTVNTKSLEQFPSIELLDLSRNNLVVITANAFQKPPANLSEINLSYNNIYVLENGAFKTVQMLKYIDLSHNLIENISRSILAAPAKSLEAIDLSWNFIKVLPADFFTNMPSLSSVSIAKNFLYTLSDKPWTVVWNQLKFSDVSGNYITCDCDLLWMFRNSTTFKAPGMAKRNINGTCIFHQIDPFFSVEYSLKSLNVNQLMCKGS